MDDGKLRALLTAVDCGSFSKAAAQLGYTQSAMTHLVNKLEAEIGCTLLERDSQGIRLTDAGRQLLPYIQNVVCACDTLLQEAAEQSDPRKRTLRIGCFASIARARLPELLRAFRAEHPEIQLDVLVRSEELTTALASGRIQLALVDEARAKGFDFQPLADAPLVAVVPPDFPWEGDTIPLERLLREPFLSSPDQYIEPFLPADAPRVEVSASDDGAILSMVAAGLGVPLSSKIMMRLRTPIMLAAMPTHVCRCAASVSRRSCATGRSAAVAGSDGCMRKKRSVQMFRITGAPPVRNTRTETTKTSVPMYPPH